MASSWGLATAQVWLTIVRRRRYWRRRRLVQHRIVGFAEVDDVPFAGVCWKCSQSACHLHSAASLCERCLGLR